MAPGILTNGWNGDVSVRTKASRKSFPYENLRFDPKLQPKKYEIAGMETLSESDAFSNTSKERHNLPRYSSWMWICRCKVTRCYLPLTSSSLDSTGEEPYRGDVYIEGMTSVVRPFELVINMHRRTNCGCRQGASSRQATKKHRCQGHQWT
jgi:hypothetical protein